MLVFVYVLYVWLLKKYTADHWGRLIVTSLLVGPAELRKREDEFRVFPTVYEPGTGYIVTHLSWPRANLKNVAEKVNTTLPHFP